MDLFMNDGRGGHEEPERALTVRVPLSLYVYIEVLREHADCSKQYLLEELLNLGVAGLMRAMPEELAEQCEADALAQLELVREAS